MAKIVLLVAYDGTHYHGFQYQDNAITVQEELEKAVKLLTGKSLRVIAASRTDAGVHALGQVVSFRTPAQLPPATWVKALNHFLPADIAVKGAWPVDDSFDVRRDAAYRQYRYSIFNRCIRSPFHLHFAYFFPHSLDVEGMGQASRTLEGQHDFASFSPEAGKLAGKTVRTVYRSQVERQGDIIQFSISANSFLPHQVRHTVGALLGVGQGKLGVADFHRILEARSPGLAGPAAPPQGLCLMKVHYPQCSPESKRNEDL